MKPAILSHHDVAWCVRRLPVAVRNLLIANPGSVFLAGGYIRALISRERVSDIDLFISTPADVDRHLLSLFGQGGIPEDRVYRSQNAVTLRQRPRIQIIHRWTFASAADGIDRFDFTIARAAIWFTGSAWASVCDENYYADLAAKRLVYCSPQREEEPGGSLLRLLKFYQRGYRAPLDSIGALLARLSGAFEYSDDESVRAADFTKALREVDPAHPFLIDATVTQTATHPVEIDEDEEVDF